MIISKDYLIQAIPSARLAFSDLNFQSIKSFPSDFFSYLKDKNYHIAIDSRDILQKDIFIALEGKKVDGHSFIKQALEVGAQGVIVEFSKIDYLKDIPVELLNNKIFIAVPNTFEALINLARTWRNYFNIPIIGITGSIGKTSTKEILKYILDAAKIPSVVSYKNQNTIIGLCKNLLKLSPSDKCGVFELGINQKGEMDELVDLLRPTMGIITQIARAHSQYLGNLNDISKEKLKIFKHFTSTNLGIICGDQTILLEHSYSHPIIKFGFKSKNQIRAKKIRSIHSSEEFNIPKISFELKLYGESIKAILNVPNPAIVKNALAAAAVANVIGCSKDSIIEGIKNYMPIEGRFEIKKIDSRDVVIINDCYNANPDSMKASLIAFHKLPSSGRKIVVLGDMLELGQKERFYHRQLGRFMHKLPSIKSILLVGERTKHALETSPLDIDSHWVSDWQEAKKFLQNSLQPKDLVLIKGSRGVGLLNIVHNIF